MNCYARLSKEVLRRPVDSGLRATVAVMDQRGFAVALPCVFPLTQRLLQGVQHEVDVHAGAHAPAHDAPREHVNDELARLQILIAEGLGGVPVHTGHAAQTHVLADHVLGDLEGAASLVKAQPDLLVQALRPSYNFLLRWCLRLRLAVNSGP